MAKGLLIGIDLGTTNSCAGIVKDGKPQVIRSKLGYSTIPSIVTFDNKGQAKVGRAAERKMILNPAETIYGSKRLIGRTYLAGIKKRFQPHFQYELTGDNDGFVAAKISGKTVKLVDVAAMILDEMKTSSAAALGDKVSGAVITVPAYFNENQRAFVREAGKRAGLNVIRILNEPTAAALCYGINRGVKKRLLVFDLGGGTFDVSIVDLDGNVFTVVGVDGDSFLGGIDFDRRMVDMILERMTKELRTQVDIGPMGMERIRGAVQEAKHQLSVQQTTMIQIPNLILVNGTTVEVNEKVSREEFEECVKDLLDQVMNVVKRALDRAGLRPIEIEEVLLVGGQTRMPAIHERIREMFSKEPTKRVHPDEVVALGAALAAGSASEETSPVLNDVLGIPIGIADIHGYFHPVINRNAPLPHEFFADVTVQPKQHQFKLAVFQGERSHAFDNEYLGTLVIDDLPPTGHTLECRLVFQLDVEGLLTVRARVEELQVDREVTLATKQTPEQVLEEMGRERVKLNIPQITRSTGKPPTHGRRRTVRVTSRALAPPQKRQWDKQRGFSGSARRRPSGVFSRLLRWILRR